ncbi:MAG: hypothetical protein ACI9B8_000994 [Sulfitobacter sp.]|jgi:uncharacterized protein YcaQ
MTLTISQARRLALSRQGLAKQDTFGRGINAVERTIRTLRYVQIDTISVVDRAHHHVLKTRVSNYQPAHLDTLLTERKSIFEYWHHAAAYLPMEDYRFYLPLMHGYGASRKIDPTVSKEVFARIRAEGPLMSKDFESPAGKRSAGWWDWKPAKLAMEQLFLSGQLMVAERRGFQKCFDLTERVLPQDTDTRLPDDQERARFYVTRILASQGISRPQDIGYMRTVTSRFEKYKILPGIRTALHELGETGEVVPVPIGKETYYALKADIDSLPARLGNRRLIPISPFDNLVINREKLSQLFGFNYQIECYVPEAKRQYGYFTLPLLLGDEFIGRMDCKAHRAQNLLAVKNIWLEPNVSVTDELVEYFYDALIRYASDLGCDSVQIETADSKRLSQKLRNRF